MLTFKYKGVTKAGTTVTGVTKAYNEYEATAKIRESVAVILSLEEVKEEKGLGITLGKKKIKDKELALLCSQFSIILKSGLPIVECVEMVADQAKSKSLSGALKRVAEDIAAGYSLAQGFESCGYVFPKTFIETIRAGEESGSLDTCFARLYKYFDKTAKVRAKVISALVYPAIVIFVAIVVFIIIMVVAVPMFTSVFEELGGELPWVTKLLIAVSNFFTNWWWILVAVVLLGWGGYTYAMKTEAGRRFISEFMITKMPLHRINSMNNSATFANTMAMMLSAGLSVVKSLEITGAIVSNYTYSIAIGKLKEGIERGRGLSECMKEIEYFPKMLTQMTGVGEKSGSLQETLDVIGEYYNNEVDLATARLLSMLEPAITIVLAVVTVILLLAVYLPMFNMYGSVV